MKTILSIFLLSVIVLATNAQSRQNAFEINKRLGRGINFGNMFEAPSETEWGNQWQPKYSRMIAEKGFNHIRIPIRWEPASRSMASSPYTINLTFLNRIKQVVDSARNNNLYVIINMHHHDALFENPDGQKARFLSQWKQISEFFKDYSDFLLFEILNEPHGSLTSDKWNIFLKDALSEIRKHSPTRVVLIGTAEWGGLGGLSNLQIPADENIILTIHYYNPFQFTHQGASWVGTEANAWLGTKWNDSDTERDVINQDFAPLLAFSKLKNIPIHIGEFGAYSTADEKSRAKWTTYLARYFETMGWSWAYWEFSAGFGIYNPSKNAYNQFLVDALLYNKMPEPATYIGTPVYNSNFQSTTDGWQMYRQSVAVSQLLRADNALKVEITNGSTEAWHIQLVKNNISLKSGKKYRFSFMAKSDIERSFTVYIGKSTDPWTSYTGYNSSNLTEKFANFSYVFDMNVTDNAARMVFDLGKAKGTLVVSDIKIEEIVLQWPTSYKFIENEKTKIYPNPVSEIIYVANADAYKNYSISNINGSVLESGILNQYTDKINISRYSPGLYILVLTNEAKNISVKIIKE